MITRVEKFRKRKKTKLAKVLIGAFLLIVLFGSSLTPTFASVDVGTLITNWFNKESDKMIAEIDQEINQEKEAQINRLKEVLQVEIDSSKAALRAFTDKEKEKRAGALKVYADNLINNIQIDDAKEKEAIANEILAIYNEAIAKMEAQAERTPTVVVEPVKVNQDKSNPEQESKVTEKKNVETNVEIETEKPAEQNSKTESSSDPTEVTTNVETNNDETETDSSDTETDDEAQ